jgi:hypothetical protein
VESLGEAGSSFSENSEGAAELLKKIAALFRNICLQPTAAHPLSMVVTL